MLWTLALVSKLGHRVGRHGELEARSTSPEVRLRPHRRPSMAPRDSFIVGGGRRLCTKLQQQDQAVAEAAARSASSEMDEVGRRWQATFGRFQVVEAMHEEVLTKRC